MNLGFKTKIDLPELGVWETHFPEKVEASFGIDNGYTPKLHTLRADPHNRWKVGRHIHFATGVQTKNYNCFRNEQNGCKSVQYITIENHNHLKWKSIKINTEKEGHVSMEEYYSNDPIYGEIGKQWLETFIKNDGFDTVEQFWAWFKQPVWTGKIIHWTDLRY